MFGGCHYNIRSASEFAASSSSPALAGAEADPKALTTMDVFVFPPSAAEQERKRLLPITLTSANALLGTSQRARRWGSIKEEMWQLPASHPRQQRQYCVDLSREAGEEITAFYANASVEAASTFFVAHLRGQVVLHEMGIAARSCGYVQATAGCETMYKFIGRRWHGACIANLTRHGHSWADMFSSPPVAPHTGDREEKPDERLFQLPAAALGADGNTTAPPTPPAPTLVMDQTSHACFPLVHVRPGKKAAKLGALPYDQHAEVHRVKRVFVVATQWDNNYHHFIVDTLTRLVRHLDWLLANPDVYLHIRGFERLARKEKVIKGGQLLRRKIFTLLGIDMRRVLIGSVLADEAWIPRTNRCNEPLAFGFELRLLADRLNAAASSEREVGVVEAGSEEDAARVVDLGGVSLPVQRVAADTDDTAGGAGAEGTASRALSTTVRPLIVVQHRLCADNEACAKTWREFSAATLQRLLSAVQSAYGDNYRIVVVSDGNAELTACVACQIRLYQQADVLIGIHGAGLTNIMFMKPGSVLVELVGEYDGRMAPVCGYHGPLAAAFGLHHYLYFWEWKEYSRATRMWQISDENLAELALGAYQFGLAVGSKR
jgi:hypothetical protein